MPLFFQYSSTLSLKSPGNPSIHIDDHAGKRTTEAGTLFGSLGVSLSLSLYPFLPPSPSLSEIIKGCKQEGKALSPGPVQTKSRLHSSLAMHTWCCIPFAEVLPGTQIRTLSLENMQSGWNSNPPACGQRHESEHVRYS